MTKNVNITLITLVQPQGITRKLFCSVQVDSVFKSFKKDPEFAYPTPETSHSSQDLRFNRRIRGIEFVNSKSELKKNFLIDNRDFNITLEFPCDSYSVAAEQFAKTADPQQTYILDLQSYLSTQQINSKTIEIFIGNMRKNNPLLSFILIINQKIDNSFLEEINILSKKLSLHCIYNEGTLDYNPAIEIAALNNLRPIDTIQQLYRRTRDGYKAIENLDYKVTLADIINNLELGSTYFQTLVDLELLSLQGQRKPALTEQLENEQIYLDFIQMLEERTVCFQKSAARSVHKPVL